MTGSEIRKKFLKYFESKGHTIVKSSSLIPINDPTLMFANAGMNQFKDLFLGFEKRDYTRATTSQKCVRAGGKHNDLENVGKTARHHTFFEMLGNFSFGDYFKEDAINFAWEFLTEELKLDKDKLWVTIYLDDDEAFDIWHKKVGVSTDRIIRLGEKDNFWSMGDTGPCGPCSEIIYDQGEHMTCSKECGIGKCDCDRFLEIWNLVFMQFNRDSDGNMTPLPKPSIDTGMGLERITAVVQKVNSNYETDLLMDIINDISKLTNIKYGYNERDNISLRVIADHIRAVTFLINDGVLPSNEGRGYVLRRIMRRAARHGKLLNINEAFLYKIAMNVGEKMRDQYPEILDNLKYIQEIIKIEEERFLATVDKGLLILNEEISNLKQSGKNIITGEVAFKLYDTFGFPLDLVEDIAAEQNFSVDKKGFQNEMARQQEQSRKSWVGSGESGIDEIYKKLSSDNIKTVFTGYTELKTDSKIIAIIKDGKILDLASEIGVKYDIITLDTPFYGESGGQAGDKGEILSPNFKFEVYDTKKFMNIVVHKSILKSGRAATNDNATLIVDTKRKLTAANHTATHLLQYALRKVLGEHVKQAGSMVNSERARFDFTHFKSLTFEELSTIEDLVNQAVISNIPLKIDEMPHDDAVKMGAMALFGEKYGDIVRVVQVPGVSVELCGGTHVKATGDIGLFKIINESSIASGVRRIEALTGHKALLYIREMESDYINSLNFFKTKRGELSNKISSLSEDLKETQKRLEKLSHQQSSKTIEGDIDNATETINGDTKLICYAVNDQGQKELRMILDRVKDKVSKGVIILAGKEGEKVSFIISVTKNLTEKVKANELMTIITPLINGKGGGRVDMAQGGGSNSHNIDKVFKVIRESVLKSLGL